MNRILLSAVVATFACSAAEAQDLAKSNKLKAALETTRTAMNDQGDANAVGIQMLAKLEADKVVVVFSNQAEASATLPAQQGGKVLSLTDSLAPYPRVIVAGIAKETSSMMTETMGAYAEREYMRISLRVRAWLELGGDHSQLPKIETLDEGYSNAALTEGFQTWLKNDRAAAIAAIAKAKGLPKVTDAMNKSQGDETALARIEPDFRAWVRFMSAEDEWRMINAHLLPQP